MQLPAYLVKIGFGVSVGLASLSALALDCSDVIYGNDNYFDNMNLLAKEAKLSDNYFNRYHESLVSDLCKGDQDSALSLVENGYVEKPEYNRIKSVLNLDDDKPVNAEMENSLHFYDTDDYGNSVYFADGISGSPEFIIIDGSRTSSMYASMHIGSILDTGHAAYAFVPGESIEDMNKNSQFAKVYIVDCDREAVEDDKGAVIKLMNMSAFHQTSAAMACSVLEAR